MDQPASKPKALGTLITDPKRASELKLVRIIGSLWAATFFGLATLTLYTGHFSGQTKQGRPISSDGDAAIAMGIFQIAVGAVMLSFFAKSGSGAMKWLFFCLALGAAAIFAAIKLR